MMETYYPLPKKKRATPDDEDPLSRAAAGSSSRPQSSTMNLPTRQPSQFEVYLQSPKTGDLNRDEYLEVPVVINKAPGQSRKQARIGDYFSAKAKGQPHKVSAARLPHSLPASPAPSKLPPGTDTHSSPVHRLQEQQSNVSTQPKRGRGRPKGSRNLHADGTGVLPPRRPRTSGTTNANGGGAVHPAKRRGRPPKERSPSPNEVYRRLKPRFIAFLCEWKGCPAELHNAETLRRHVQVLHCRDPRPLSFFSCKWGKCAMEQPLTICKDREALVRHIEESHLWPLVWHTGDGPRSQIISRHPLKYGDECVDVEGAEDSSIPDFLLDDRGKQVTPSVKDQQLEDMITWRNNRRKLRELLRHREENLADDEDEGEVGAAKGGILPQGTAPSIERHKHNGKPIVGLEQ